jgi:hypothetical protein
MTTTDRTLPVTPAERFLVTVLRAYLAWNTDEANDPEGATAWCSMLKLGEYLVTRCLVESTGRDLTPAGRELLARVEAEERTPATVLRATLSRLRDAINNPPDGDDNDWKSAMRAALREHEAALAGTTPIDAPPRKPDR